MSSTSPTPSSAEHDPRTCPQHLAIECDVAAVPPARAQVLESLASTGRPQQQLDDAAAVMGELVMNALIHGSPDDDGLVHLTWSVDGDGAVHLAVSDAGGATEPRIEAPDAGDGGGRGMRLVDALCERWSVETGEGTRVEAVLSETSPQLPRG